MATRAANPAMLGGLGKFAELRRRMLFVIGALGVFLLVTYQDIARFL